jgi:hypothetical protein
MPTDLVAFAALITLTLLLSRDTHVCLMVLVVYASVAAQCAYMGTQKSMREELGN